MQKTQVVKTEQGGNRVRRLGGRRARVLYNRSWRPNAGPGPKRGGTTYSLVCSCWEKTAGGKRGMFVWPVGLLARLMGACRGRASAPTPLPPPSAPLHAGEEDSAQGG